MHNTATDTKAILLNYALAIADELSKHGIKRSVLLRECGIPDHLHSDKNAFISIKQYQLLLENTLNMSGKPAIGLCIGTGITFGHHGTFAFAALSFPSVWDAFTAGLKFSLLVNRVVDLQLEEKKDFNCIHIDSTCFTGTTYRALIEIAMATFQQIFTVLGVSDSTDIEYHFCYAQPEYNDDYKATLKGRIFFDSSDNLIKIPKTIANQQLLSANALTAKHFDAECDEQINNMLEKLSIEQQLEQVLLRGKASFPSLNQAAAELHLSPRTLRRRLHEHNTSYQKILDQLRLRLAQRYLSMSERSINEIAQLLGYGNQNSFSHAFKVLSGSAPSTYRKQQKSKGI